jgi:transposase
MSRMKARRISSSRVRLCSQRIKKNNWQKYGIRLIAPHKYNRRRKNTQDGRELRRYCRRWKMERHFAWLHNFRRLVSRWEYHEPNSLGMLQLGCLIISLRHL